MNSAVNNFKALRTSKRAVFTIAVITVLVVIALNSAARATFGNYIPMSLFITAIVVAAWLGGFRAGIAATLLGGLADLILYSRPGFSLLDQGQTDLVRIIVYSAQGIAISYVFGRLHKAQDRLVEAQRRAEEANQSKSLFLANMSHEIRTPLGALLGFAELLKEPELSVRDRIRYAGIVERTGIDLLAIVNDILDLSKVEAEKLELETVKFSPREFLAEIHSFLALRCLNKCLELEFVPIGFVPDHMIADPLRIRQILMNLLGNAIKFTQEGKVRLEYFAEEAGDRGILHFRIVDSGIGVSIDQQARLFEHFSQGDNSITRRFAGTGLGLALSRRLANLMGGDVALLESTEGRGSVFSASVAYRRVIPSEIKLVPPPQDVSARLFPGKNVLVADDSADNRLLFECLLTKLGLNVSLAENGEEALRLVRSNHFDIVLMDMQMPVMNGYEATAVLSETHPNLPVIALTAHAMKEDRDKCLKVGCRDYLTKPVQHTQLVNALITHLSPSEVPHAAEPRLT